MFHITKYWIGLLFTKLAFGTVHHTIAMDIQYNLDILFSGQCSHDMEEFKILQQRRGMLDCPFFHSVEELFA